MRIVNVSHLKGNEILGKQLYDDTGRILLNQGVKLVPNFIQRLMDLGIQTVYIDDEISKELVIEETISEKTRQMSKAAVKEMLDKYSREGKTDNSGIMKSVNSVLDDILANKEVLVNVAEIRSTDNSLYSHSVNVCVIASIIATHLGYNMIKLKDLATGAMLHDVGKVKILNDKKLTSGFKSKAELDQYVEMMHPKVGYDFLTEQNFCSAHSRVAVLMHHENIDGSGYPLRLKGEEISEMAKLICICDVFDNMVAGKNNEEPKPVYEVIEYLMAMSNFQFDAELVRKFSMNIAAFPTGSGIILNTHEKCLVARQNISMPIRPVVKVVYDGLGNLIPEPYEIDLLKELTLFITNTCEI